WLNGQYMIATDENILASLVMPFLVQEGIVSEGQTLDMSWLAAAVRTLRERCKTLVELAQSLRYYILDHVDIDPKAREKFLKPDQVRLLSELTGPIAGLAEFTADELGKIFQSFTEERGLKLGAVAQPMRVAITGGTASPGIFEVMEIVGKEKVLKRLARVTEEK
ncbi:MAG TPA: glutamate--tRNA ligase, partial [Dissulfurispiraceae bacterium]|nr:glutamate--tRNA ligase [Dissulfurispiraceae bacterium]